MLSLYNVAVYLICTKVKEYWAPIAIDWLVSYKIKQILKMTASVISVMTTMTMTTSEM